MLVLAANQISTGRTIKVDLTTLSLLLLVIGFSEAQETNLGLCSAYCTRNNQQKDAFTCPSTNDTAKSIYCCGSAIYKYCCSNLLDLAPDTSKTYCPNKIKYDWIIIITIVITVAIFVLGLTACLCLCRKKCGCKNVVCSEAGELPSSSEVPPESAAPSSTASDFDPSSPCAFAPPAYDTLPKDPPPYTEEAVFTISNGCNYTDPPPSDQTLTNPQLESMCNSLNENQPLPEYTDSIHPEAGVPRGSMEPPRGSSSTLDLCPPYELSPATVSSNHPSSVSPPSYSSSGPPTYSTSPRPTRSMQHRPSLSLAMELHPLNLGVAGSRLSSPAPARVYPVAV